MLIFTLCSVQGSWQGLEGQAKELQDLGLSRDAGQGICSGLGALNPRCLPLLPAWSPQAQQPELGSQEGRGRFTQLGLTKPRPHFPLATSDFYTWISRDFFGFCMPDSFSSV